jgi:hypothetical protein
MRFDVRATVLVVLAALSTACSEDAGDAVTRWDEAAARVGDHTKVCGPPQGIRRSRDATLLDVGVEYPDPDRFTIVIAGPPADLADVTRDGVLEVCATGEVTQDDGVVQVRLQSASEIQVVTYDDLNEGDNGIPY